VLVCRCSDVNPVQIIGMSATLPNLDVVARWIDADLYRTDFRPVPLLEMVKIGPDVYDCTLTRRLRTVPAGHSMTAGKPGDDGDVIPLCLETVCCGCSVLVFCPTKNWCEKVADSIAREFYRLTHEVHPPEKGSLFAPTIIQQVGAVCVGVYVSGHGLPPRRNAGHRLRRTAAVRLQACCVI